MEAMLIAATDLVALLSPSRIEALADRVRGSLSAERDGSLHQLVTTPAARVALDRLIATWKQTRISGDVLAGILVGAAYARQQAQRESSVELVWTGPTTPFVATRRTEQVLLDLIHHAQSDLFLVSFVAYDVSSVVDALNAAAARGIDIRILLETLHEPRREPVGRSRCHDAELCAFWQPCMSGPTGRHRSPKDGFTRKWLSPTGIQRS